MWARGDRDWREKLWEHMLEMMPVEVLVNLHSSAFSLRALDSTSIYADDVSIDQYELMLDEWAQKLGEREGGRSLCRELCVAALERAYANGHTRVHFRLPADVGPVNVTVNFKGKPCEEPFIIRFQPSF